MSRELAFNLALARIDRIGFHRCVMFSNLVGAPLPTTYNSVVATAEKKISRAPAKRYHVANRLDPTERVRQRKAAHAKERLLRLGQQAFELEQES